MRGRNGGRNIRVDVWQEVILYGKSQNKNCSLFHFIASHKMFHTAIYEYIIKMFRKYERGTIAGRRQAWVLGGICRQTSEIILICLAYIKQ